MKNYTRIPNQLIRCGVALNQSEFRVLLVLMSLMPCYPSRADIAAWTGLSLNTVKRALITLKQKKLISWQRGNGFGRNNRYFVDHKATLKMLSKGTKIGPISRAKIGPLKRLIWKEEKNREYSDEELEHILASLPETKEP